MDVDGLELVVLRHQLRPEGDPIWKGVRAEDPGVADLAEGLSLFQGNKLSTCSGTRMTRPSRCGANL
eukprot:8943402-Alexandrium_andersonii.AAC.1